MLETLYEIPKNGNGKERNNMMDEKKIKEPIVMILIRLFYTLWIIFLGLNLFSLGKHWFQVDPIIWYVIPLVLSILIIVIITKRYAWGWYLIIGVTIFNILQSGIMYLKSSKSIEPPFWLPVYMLVFPIHIFILIYISSKRFYFNLSEFLKQKKWIFTICRMLIGLIALCGIAYLPYFGGRIQKLPRKISFESQRWINARWDGSDNNIRYKMHKDLIKKYKLIGMAKNEIIELLGSPQVQIQPFSSKNLEFYYAIGKSPEYDGMDAWLVLKCKDNKVVKYQIMYCTEW